MIEIENLQKTFLMGEESVHALAGVDLRIDAGEFVAIMGTSGSGKSTLLNLLGCLDTPTKGSYCLRGTEIYGRSDEELAHIRNREIGFVFQTFNLLPRMTAAENVALPLMYAGIARPQRLLRAHEILQMVGLGNRMDHRPSQMSGGQRQRVAIARALIQKPAILLADEPTGNLDSSTSIDIMSLFQDLHREGQTVILVTHEPDIAEYAKRTVTLRDGKIIEDRSHAA